MHPFRRTLPLALLALACAATAAAQEGRGAKELASLRTPTSPAFVIIGVEPTSVERPTTPRAFALQLLSASRGSAGIIPENYAAEVAPYWLLPHRRLTFSEYYDPKPLQALMQTFSVSIATAHRAAGADTTTAVGIGFRVSPLPGLANATADSLHRELLAVQRERNELAVRQADAEDRQDAAEVARITAQLTAIGNRSAALAQQLRASIADDDERVGLRLQFAGALAALYSDDDFGAGRVENSGVWGTAAYRLEGTPVDLLALGRYLGGAGNTRAWDVGGRAVVAVQDLSLSAEFIARSAAGDAVNTRNEAGGLASGNRLVGMLEYRATPDLYVTFSFGQDYRRPGSVGSPVVAILGGSLNFGPKPALLLP